MNRNSRDSMATSRSPSMAAVWHSWRCSGGVGANIFAALALRLQRETSLGRSMSFVFAGVSYSAHEHASFALRQHRAHLCCASKKRQQTLASHRKHQQADAWKENRAQNNMGIANRWRRW